MKITNTELQAAKAWFRARISNDYTVYEAMRSTLKEFETRWAEIYHIATHGIFVLSAFDNPTAVFLINRGLPEDETLLAFYNAKTDKVELKIGSWGATASSKKYTNGALFPCVD